MCVSQGVRRGAGDGHHYRPYKTVLKYCFFLYLLQNIYNKDLPGLDEGGWRGESKVFNTLRKRELNTGAAASSGICSCCDGKFRMALSVHNGLSREPRAMSRVPCARKPFTFYDERCCCCMQLRASSSSLPPLSSCVITLPAAPFAWADPAAHYNSTHTHTVGRDPMKEILRTLLLLLNFFFFFLRYSR